MSTSDGTIELEYKTGSTDDVISQLLQNGSPVDLTDYDTVVFNISDGDGHSFSVPCTKGSIDHSASEGGVTINLSDTHLATAGEYECEFVASKSGDLAIFPNENKYYVLKIYPAIQVT